MPDSSTPRLLIAHCLQCGGHGYPPAPPGCRVCGAPPERLRQVAPPQTPRLRNFVTLHTELVPGLPVPCVIGEVELAPGVVEEARIAAHDESSLVLDMPLQALPEVDADGRVRWQFAPLEGAVA